MNSITDCVLPADEPVDIRQGFNGQASHHVINEENGTKVDDSYSLDFAVSEGSQVYASRNGTVVAVDDSHNFNYFPKPGDEIDADLVRKAIESNNYIWVEHTDGTIAIYAHLQQNGSTVKTGDEVIQGQPIAKSGNTGLSSEPHLHFSVFVEEVDGFRRKTIPFSFTNYDGPLEDRVINPELYQ